jgi:lysozyme
MAYYRPALLPGERYGIDVSHHQGVIDWERVANDGISFAYMKATEGNEFVDERFADNWRGAANAGLDRGAYHYFPLCSPGAARPGTLERCAAGPDGLLKGSPVEWTST